MLVNEPTAYIGAAGVWGEGVKLAAEGGGGEMVKLLILMGGGGRGRGAGGLNWLTCCWSRGPKGGGH